MTFLIQFKCSWLNWFCFRLKSATFSYFGPPHLDFNCFYDFMIKIYVSSELKRANTESKPRSSLANHTKLSQRLEICLLALFSALTSIMFQNSYLKSLHPTWGIFCFRRSHTLSGSARKALSCLHGGLFEVKTPWRELFVITRCWIDVSFQNDLFTWPPAVRFSDGLSGSTRNTSNVFE